MGKGRKAGIVNAVLGIDIKKFSTGLQNAKRQMKMTAKRFSVHAQVIAGVGAGFAAFAVNAARNMENLTVRLNTAFQGNETAARDAFRTINNFTKKTPFQLEEVADAFIKLKNMGLDPSMSSLESYGNTAAAMGKSLNQMIEAVADAATGEFERLKAFGIKARSEGDKVSFTFRGVTTTVAKNASEIQKYLLDIGNTQFAGGIEAQSQTLDGQLSTLKDNVTLLAAEFGYVLLPAIKQLVKWTTKLIDRFGALRRNTKDIDTTKMLDVDVMQKRIELLTEKIKREGLDGTFADKSRLKEVQDEIKSLKLSIKFARELNAIEAKRSEKRKTTTTTPTPELTKEQIERAKLLSAAAKDRSMGVIGPMTGVGVEMNQTITQVQTLTQRLNEQFYEVRDAGKQAFTDLANTVDTTVEQMNNMLNSFVTGGLTFFAQKLGEAMAGGGFKNGELGQGILEMTGQFMQQLGGLMIATGVSLEAFKKGLQTMNPALLIGGGIALIAAGAAVSHFAQTGYGNSTTGGASSSGFGSGRDNGNRPQIAGVIRGADLHLLYGDHNRRRR